MKYIKPELTPEQLEVLQDLIRLASIGCPKEISCLNEHQRMVIQDLKKKGCVTLFKKEFMVLLAP
jgi:hypothetical protein